MQAEDYRIKTDIIRYYLLLSILYHRNSMTYGHTSVGQTAKICPVRFTRYNKNQVS